MTQASTFFLNLLQYSRTHHIRKMVVPILRIVVHKRHTHTHAHTHTYAHLFQYLNYIFFIQIFRPGIWTCSWILSKTAHTSNMNPNKVQFEKIYTSHFGQYTLYNACENVDYEIVNVTFLGHECLGHRPKSGRMVRHELRTSFFSSHPHLRERESVFVCLCVCVGGGVESHVNKLTHTWKQEIKLDLYKSLLVL